jgi:hypothetical protein
LSWLSFWLVRTVRPGATNWRSRSLVMLRSASESALTTATATGVFSSASERRCAVTTISPASTPSSAAACAEAVAAIEMEPSATVLARTRASALFIVHSLIHCRCCGAPTHNSAYYRKAVYE